MKNICMITGAFNEYFILTPLMKEIQKDTSLYLTVISSGRQKALEFEITYLRQEEEGFTIDEKTNIVFTSQKKIKPAGIVKFPQSEYARILKNLRPDIVILPGNRYETFSAAIAASQLNLPIAHIQGGESDFGTWDNSYGYGITKLSHLHFTSTKRYRRQVIKFGEHPQSVFNVGSLLLEKIKMLSLRGRSLFTTETGFDKADPFIFVCFRPDTSLGSKNKQFFQNIADSLTDERFKKFKLLINKPEPTGLGKIMIQMIDSLVLDHPDKVAAMPTMNLSDLSRAVKYSSALIGNTREGEIIASGFKTPVIHVGKKLPTGMNVPNRIGCPPEKKEIIRAVQHGLSAEFKAKIQDRISPFEQAATSKKIKDIVKGFSRTDITHKAFYSHGLHSYC